MEELENGIKKIERKTFKGKEVRDRKSGKKED